VTQERGWIDARGEPRRPEHRAHCHNQEQNRNRGERPQIASIDAENVRFRNSRSGITGSGLRRSTQTKIARNAIPPPTHSQKYGSVKPRLEFSATVKPIRSGTSPRVSVTTPA